MKKILIVDDEPMMVMLAARALSDRYEIIKAESGAEALALYSEDSPDMIISDVLMPGMNGFELRDRLRAMGADVPFVFMTGDERENSEERSRQGGAAAFVRKPASPAVLRETVAKVFSESAGS